MWLSEKKLFAECKEIVKKYAGQYQLTEKAKAELTHAMKTIERLQDECPHYYKLYTGLNQIRRICVDCDKEDLTYKFYNPEEK